MIFHIHHAAPRLTVGKQPVGALFGFTRMLTRMMKYLQKAEYCGMPFFFFFFKVLVVNAFITAVIFESPDAPSRRRDIIANYKSARTTPPAVCYSFFKKRIQN